MRSEIIRTALVKQLSVCDGELKTAKASLEQALAEDSDLTAPTKQLDTANQDFKNQIKHANMHLPKAGTHSYADYLISSLGRGVPWASRKLQLDREKIREYWQRVDPTHPGALVNGNIVGLYGDDCKYNNVGEKLIGIAMNVVLFEPKSPLYPKEIFNSANVL
eukprot:s2673_g8.t1